MNETKKREILNINNRKNQQSVEKNSYVLKKEDYKKLFYLKAKSCQSNYKIIHVDL